MRLLTSILLLCITSLAVTADDVRPFVYVTLTDDDYDMVIIDLNTGERLYSVSESPYDCLMEQSPDRQIVHYSTGRGNPTSDNDFILNIATGETHSVPEQARHPDAPYVRRWSPDSQHLAFSSPTEESYETLYVYEPESNTLTALGTARQYRLMQWYNDDLYFIFDDAERLFFGKWDGSEVIPLPSDILTAVDARSYLSLSPDVQTLFTRVSGENTPSGERVWQYALIDISKEKIHLLEPSAELFDIVWHPNGTHFVYVKGKHNIILYDVNNHTSEVIAHTNYRENYLTLPGWSPDGRYLSYNEHIPGGTRAPHYRINVLEVDTGQTLEIAYWVAEHTGHVRWVSDTELVYTYAYSEVHPAETSAELYYSDVMTQEARQLTDTPHAEESFRCSWG